MFGHRNKFGGEPPFMHMAGRFGGRGGFGPFGGQGGGHRGHGGGRGGPGDILRAGRMLADGDLKLIALMLLSQTPRHGYDIIKALEDISSGVYSPSPGVVYPTLTFLEEAGYAVSATEGSKKVYSITEEGQAHLEQNRAMVEGVLEQIERFGHKMAKAREWFGWDDEASERRGRHPGRDPRFHALRRRLKAALADVAGAPAEKQDEAIAILENAAEALEALSRA